MVTNRRLARAISDARWGRFVRLLEEKAERYGRTVATVSRWLPSWKTCSVCGHVMDAIAVDGSRMVLFRLWCPARS
jgi:putative transposase